MALMAYCPKIIMDKRPIKCSFHLASVYRGFSFYFFTWRAVKPYILAINTRGLNDSLLYFVPPELDDISLCLKGQQFIIQA